MIRVVIRRDEGGVLTITKDALRRSTGSMNIANIGNIT
jgi:hypothetical protein